MKQKSTFNHYLYTYNKYVKKLSRLQVTGSNFRRQNILKKHIARLEKKLKTLLLQIRPSHMATAMAITGMFAMSNNAAAQTFGAAQELPFSLTDIGIYSIPAFADLDNDGDLDMMSGALDGNFYYFENTGTATVPTFGAVQQNPFSLTDIGVRSTPTFADLDNDGDLDMMSGATDQNFYYFENIGTASAPIFGAVQENPFSLTDIGSTRFSPTFADLDNDGDLDMMSGERGGKFYYFENIGTAAAPTFGEAQELPFSLTDIGNFSTPTFVDLDNDGDFDMLSGSYDDYSPANFYYFENTGTASAPIFGAVQENPFDLIGLYTGEYNQTSPAFADLDNDGDLDMMSGGVYGKFYYFENNPSILSTNEIEEIDTELLLSPNPASDIVTVSVSANLAIQQIIIVNMTGQTVQQTDVNNISNTASLDISSLVSGMYIVKIGTSNNTITKKLMVK